MESSPLPAAESQIDGVDESVDRTEDDTDGTFKVPPSSIQSSQVLKLCARVALRDDSERLLIPGSTHIPQDLVHMDPPVLQLRLRAG